MSKIIRQMQMIDGDTGEVLRDVTTSGNPNGKGYILMYTERVEELILKCPSATTLKVFMLLSMGQQFEERGVITTKKAIQEKLGITKKTCIDAFKWLKENFIVNECKVNGVTEFMVNPEYVTVGRDRKKRQVEWVRRWKLSSIKLLPSEMTEMKVVKSGRSIDFD